MVRNALAGALAVLLVQLTVGAGCEQIAEARSRGSWWRGALPGTVTPTSATAEALARSAAISTAPPAAIAVSSSEAPTPAVMPVGPDANDACPRDMALVEGEYCTDVRQDCMRWLDDETLPFARCAEYRSPSRCVGSHVKERFCIDRYEYTAPG